MAQVKDKAQLDAEQAKIDKWQATQKEIQKTRLAIVKAESSVVPLYFRLFVLLLADTYFHRGDWYTLSQQEKYRLAGGSSFYYRARNIYKHFMKIVQKTNPTADTLTLTPQAEQLAKEYKGGLVELLKSMAGTSNREAKPLTDKQIQNARRPLLRRSALWPRTRSFRKCTLLRRRRPRRRRPRQRRPPQTPAGGRLRSGGMMPMLRHSPPRPRTPMP